MQGQKLALLSHISRLVLFQRRLSSVGASSPADIFRSILSPSLVNDVLKRRSIEFNGFYRNKGQLRQSRVVLTPMRFTNISLSEFSSKALIVSIFEERVGFDPKSKHCSRTRKACWLDQQHDRKTENQVHPQSFLSENGHRR